MALWLVRAGGRGECEGHALDHNKILIGWDDMSDISDVNDRDQLFSLVNETYPDQTQHTLRNWNGQLWAFKSRIKRDDLVVLPLKSRSAIAIGKVVGDYEYDNSIAGGHHQRKVEWIETDLPRSRFDQDLLYSFGAFMTVCQIKRNNAEERVRNLLQGKSSTYVPPMELVTDNEELEDSIEALPNIEELAREQIRSFVSQKFRGHKLSNLVADILRAQGYKVKESPPGADGGVDIIAGKGDMGFDSPRLAVQVKSSDTPLSVEVVRELQGVMSNFGADHGLVVSWGGFKETTRKEAARLFFSLRLWDDGDVVRYIQEYYDDLSDELQAEIPLKRFWMLVNEEG